MKTCAACHKDLPKDSYSKKQWKLDECQRRCKVCIANNREVQPPPQQDKYNNDQNTNEIISKLDAMYLEIFDKKINDEELFKQPPSQYEDCPICFLLLPVLNGGIRYQSCCGKLICCGCFYAPVYDNQGNEVDNQKCSFCRTPHPASSEEAVERMKKRMEAGDAEAIYNQGSYYRDGRNGFPQDYNKALELWHRAGELGYAEAYVNIGYSYNTGRGVEVDKEKAKCYFEHAAVMGSTISRHNLGRNCLRTQYGGE